jgi:hypothetical protein
MLYNEENIALWSSQILYIFVLSAIKITKIIKNGYFSQAECKYIQNLGTSQGYIFLILQHFATKLCNFTHFKILFPAMVMVSFFLSTVDQNFVYSWNHPFPVFLWTKFRAASRLRENLNLPKLLGPVIQSWISANPGLKLNLLFQFIYFCTPVYFKTSEKETTT